MKKCTTEAAYEEMFALIQQALPELTIEAREISDSYCPGTYDFSVNGQKIAGTAQRRIKDGIAIMMYLSVNGDQIQRGNSFGRFTWQACRLLLVKMAIPPFDQPA